MKTRPLTVGDKVIFVSLSSDIYGPDFSKMIVPALKVMQHFARVKVPFVGRASAHIERVTPIYVNEWN